jgi:hypothetical protein
MSIIVQQDATTYSLLYFCKLPYMFRVVSSGAHVTVITASGTGQTVSATSRYRREVGTATSSTFLIVSSKLTLDLLLVTLF